MKQLGLGLNLSTKKTRKREFLEEMDRVVTWDVLVQLVEPYCPRAKTGRRPFAVATLLRIHYMQQWFGLSDPAMEEALHDVPLYREYARLDDAAARLPDETTILRFRHLLEKHSLAVDMLRVVNDLLLRKGLMLRNGTAVDATLIAAPSSTKNADAERDPEMKQTKKGNSVRCAAVRGVRVLPGSRREVPGRIPQRLERHDRVRRLQSLRNGHQDRRSQGIWMRCPCTQEVR
jgi:IS5 family transposase